MSDTGSNATPTSGSPPAPRPKKAPPGRMRRCWRGARRCFLALTLLAGVVLIYLNQAGVPEPLKRRLLAEVRRHGMDLEFSSLRFRWYRGLVAETVTLAGSGDTPGPELTIPELAFRLDLGALWHGRVQVESLEFFDGRLVLPLHHAGETPQIVPVNRINASLRFLPDDRWSLDHFTAEWLGAKLSLSGVLTNGSRLREWAPQPTLPRARGPWQPPLRRFVNVVKRLRFGQTPDLQLEIRGDAEDPDGLTVSLRFTAGDARTEWGTLEQVILISQFNQPSGTNDLGRSHLQLEVAGVRTPWTELERATLDLTWTQSVTNPVPAQLAGELALDQIFTPWGETPMVRFAVSGGAAPDRPDLLSSELRLVSGHILAGMGRSGTNTLTARFLHDTDHLLPQHGEWALAVDAPQFDQGEARRFEMTGILDRREDPMPARPGSEWAWWDWVAPFRGTVEVTAEGLNLSAVKADHAAVTLDWLAPRLQVRSWDVELYGHSWDGSADLDLEARRAVTRTRFDFDVRHLDPFLTAGARRWLDNYQWDPAAPPQVEGWAALDLPAWTNMPPGWTERAIDDLVVQGTVQARHAAYRGVAIDAVQFQFERTNRFWHLWDFAAQAPDGRLEFEYLENDDTRDYRFDLRSHLDPEALKPLVPEAQRRAFDLFVLGERPHVRGWVQGRWRSPERTGFALHVDAGAFTFRGEPIDQLTADLAYTNGVLTATDIELLAGEGSVRADGVLFNTTDGWLHLTNALSTIAPERITAAIGPKTAEVLRPYRFERPPQARVEGSVQTRDTRQARLRVDVEGGPFRYWRFHLPDVRATVRWEDEAVFIDGLEASFYEGRIEGSAGMDLTRPTGAMFRFDTTVTNANFHTLMVDLLNPTNHLEGRLSGSWTVTEALSDDWNSWQGYGEARLTDGFLWGIPLFGIFTRILDGVIPGIGHSKVSGLTATFRMTNSILHTTDLRLRSSAARLDYRGYIDFRGNVDARVEALVLRETAVVGPLVSLLFKPLTKLLEYKVTGTLGHPKTEPLYIPKPLLFPLNPIGTLKEMFGSDKESEP